MTEHTFITQDDYKVTAWRIKSKSDIQKPKKCPILLMHGLMDNGSTWFFLENTSQTLPILLLKQGYDIWIGNNRGTKYCKQGYEKDGYWDFCFDHLCKYDMPALINGVLEVAGTDKLAYIGHSQGCTQLLAAVSENAQLSQKITTFVGLGPVISLGHHSKDSLLEILKKYPIVELINFLGFKSMLHMPDWVVQCIGILTYNTDFYYNLIARAIAYICGYREKENFCRKRLGAILSHQPGGTSTMNTLQWMQVSRKGVFTKYDYGCARKNKQMYGVESPPIYNFQKLRESTRKFKKYLFRGTRDCLVDEKDFDHLVSMFSDEAVYTYKIQDYAHLDYVWAGNAYYKIYSIVDQIMSRDNL